MANDHRGRPVHAGKRTNDALGLTSSWHNAPHGMGGWSVHGPAELFAGTEPSSGARGIGFDPRSPMGDSGEPYGRAYGVTRTPYRSEVAANAMAKRIEEGRDLRTGRS